MCSKFTKQTQKNLAAHQRMNMMDTVMEKVYNIILIDNVVEKESPNIVLTIAAILPI